MSAFDLIKERRTIRKFHQKPVPKDILKNCIDAGRLAPSSANRQPLEFITVTKDLEPIFGCTRWAGYLNDGTPKQGEKPTVYIIIISNKKISEDARYDVGLAAENITLTALEKGVASCIIASLEKPILMDTLKIPSHYEIELVIALGYPAQESKEAEIKDNNDIKYWLDENNVLNVPKRSMKDVMHEEEF
ncbi:MAG: nitroreductase family protein [Candidatus Woesearchaeota archaeon]